MNIFKKINLKKIIWNYYYIESYNLRKVRISQFKEHFLYLEHFQKKKNGKKIILKRLSIF